MISIGEYKRESLAAPMTWDFCMGELDELIEAVEERDASHVHEEWNDVLLCLLAWMSKYVPIDWMPIFPGFGLFSAHKFAARTSVWVQIFEHHGVSFNKVFLSEGSNFRKRHKVRRVLGLAGVAPKEVDLVWVGNIVGGFEG
tara:strand:- start:872 stop:1297 length:426 start_codon:yes stop_codon:yes gene_type:complete